jgi:hypothetical protein
MAEFLYDLRRASRKIPEENTARIGGELSYDGKASRMGSAGTLQYASVPSGLQALSIGDFVNILIQVPETEHWFVRAFGLTTFRNVGTMSSVKASFHTWTPISQYLSSLDTWSSPDLSYTPPRTPLGLEPFSYTEEYWRQISSEISVAVAATHRFNRWIFDKDVWQRHIYAKEIVLVRIEVTVAVAGSQATLNPSFDVVRYPTPAEIIRRMIQRDGAMRADVTLAGIIEAEADRMSLED